MMYGYDMTAMGWAVMLGGWALLIVAILAGAWLIARAMGDGSPTRHTPADILAERFARGDINQEEYERAKKALT
jgi:putative membrane protein